jgi:hypothetical protein
MDPPAKSGDSEQARESEPRELAATLADAEKRGEGSCARAGNTLSFFREFSIETSLFPRGARA